jgi:hypothetical protein
VTEEKQAAGRSSVTGPITPFEHGRHREWLDTPPRAEQVEVVARTIALIYAKAGARTARVWSHSHGVSHVDSV